MYSVICPWEMGSSTSQKIRNLGGQVIPFPSTAYTAAILPDSVQTGEVDKEGGASMFAIKFPDGEIVAYNSDHDWVLLSSVNLDEEYLWESFKAVLPVKEKEMLTEDQIAKLDHEYLEKQAPLRAAWIAGDEEAGKKLEELVAEYTAKCPPITGKFTYTQEDVNAAKKAGFHE